MNQLGEVSSSCTCLFPSSHHLVCQSVAAVAECGQWLCCCCCLCRGAGAGGGVGWRGGETTAAPGGR